MTSMQVGELSSHCLPTQGLSVLQQFNMFLQGLQVLFNIVLREWELLTAYMNPCH